jgi:hypothetical protein
MGRKDQPARPRPVSGPKSALAVIRTRGRIRKIKYFGVLPAMFQWLRPVLWQEEITAFSTLRR